MASQRALRLLKVQQEVSGCFRSDRGADAFSRTRRSLFTRTNQGARLLAALETVFTGQLFYPSFG